MGDGACEGEGGGSRFFLFQLDICLNLGFMKKGAWVCFIREGERRKGVFFI